MEAGATLAAATDEVERDPLRLDVDQSVGKPPYYGIPAGNPFESSSDGVKDEIWAKGIRNPWRF